jgi:hypothetical protein
MVYTYTISTNPPTLLSTVHTSSKASIRGLHVDYKKFYIFTGTLGGRICVLELGLPGKERFIKEISAYNTNTKVRLIRYNSTNNELIVGDEDGKILIFSLKRGESICK